MVQLDWLYCGGSEEAIVDEAQENVGVQDESPEAENDPSVSRMILFMHFHTCTCVVVFSSLLFCTCRCKVEGLSLQANFFI